MASITLNGIDGRKVEGQYAFEPDYPKIPT